MLVEFGELKGRLIAPRDVMVPEDDGIVVDENLIVQHGDQQYTLLVARYLSGEIERDSLVEVEEI